MFARPHSRILIQNTMMDTFMEKLKERFEQITLGGDPLTQGTLYGPVVDKIQFDKVMGYIEEEKIDSGANYLRVVHHTERRDTIFRQPSSSIPPMMPLFTKKRSSDLS